MKTSLYFFFLYWEPKGSPKSVIHLTFDKVLSLIWIFVIVVSFLSCAFFARFTFNYWRVVRPKWMKIQSFIIQHLFVLMMSLPRQKTIFLRFFFFLVSHFLTNWNFLRNLSSLIEFQISISFYWLPNLSITN